MSPVLIPVSIAVSQQLIQNQPLPGRSYPGAFSPWTGTFPTVPISELLCQLLDTTFLAGLHRGSLLPLTPQDPQPHVGWDCEICEIRM